MDEGAGTDEGAGADENGAGEDGVILDPRAGIDPDGTGEAGVGGDLGGFMSHDAGLNFAIACGEGGEGALDGFADGGEIVAGGVDKGGGSLELVTLDGHSGGDDFGEELFLEVLVSDGLDEGEGLGVDEVHAGGLKLLGVVDAGAGGDGDGGGGGAMVPFHGGEVEIVMGGGLDGDEGVVTEPFLEVAEAAGGTAGEGVFGVVDIEPGLGARGELGGDQFGFAIGTDGDF